MAGVKPVKIEVNQPISRLVILSAGQLSCGTANLACQTAMEAFYCFECGFSGETSRLLQLAWLCKTNYYRSPAKYYHSQATECDSLRVLSPFSVTVSAIRLQCHQLFMSGVFKDMSSKLKFGILFTRHYSAIYADFVRDDHYRSVSATAVTVQIYTVTTVVSP